MSKNQLHLHKLKELATAISPTQCDYFVEACIVALENQEHHSPIIFTVEGDFEQVLTLSWSGSVKKEGWQEERISAENGSIAIAFFLILEMTDYKVIQQSI